MASMTNKTTRSTRRSVYTQIYAVVRQIPRGAVLTYGQVAQRAGLPHGARQVGYAMRAAAEDLPWHRVVGLSRPGFGRISIGDPVVADLQRQMLMSEGIEFNVRGEICLVEP